MVKKFDIREAEKMSDNEVMAIVCDGLSEVCDNMADTTKEQKGGIRVFTEKCPCCKKVRKIKRKISALDYPKSFREKAEVFKAFAKINRALALEEKNGKSRR